MSIRTYTNDRGLLLLYVGEPSSKPIITLENYTKWYNVYLVQPDGQVAKVDPGTIAEAANLCTNGIAYSDHCFHPELLEKLGELLDAHVDERAEEVATGRWIIEVSELDIKGHV